jgi:hypothetical protein
VSDRVVHVVGGGLAGLVAAITAAEDGAPVVLYEASSSLGGRALGGTDQRGVNLGPHVLFADGAVLRWFRSRDLPVPLHLPPARGARLLDDTGTHFPLVPALRLGTTLPRFPAPVDQSFREWSDGRFGTPLSELLCRLSGLFSFHHDPGSLSARFVWDRYRRTFLRPDRVRWVAGGWGTLVDALAQRARSLGVRIEVEAKVTPDSLPEGPVVLATTLAEAGHLLGRRLRWPGSRTALLDVVARPDGRWPALVADVRSDITTCCMIERETAVEPGLAGPGVELFQAQLGIAPGAGAQAGLSRLEDAFDRAIPGWRASTLWSRGHVVAGSTGAVDPPGATWRDRPAVTQGDGRFLAGDAVAAPGMLSEVSVNSAVRAARLAVEDRRQRAFAPGWPRLELTPRGRLEILAAALPSAALDGAGAGGWDLEPVDETGPGYRLAVRGSRVLGSAEDREGGVARLTAVVASGRSGVLARSGTRAARAWRSAMERRRR